MWVWARHRWITQLLVWLGLEQDVLNVLNDDGTVPSCFDKDKIVPLANGEWADGDVIGCLLDAKQNNLHFYKNGVDLQDGAPSFVDVKGAIGLCPALTIDCGFLGFFNLGETPFRFPPNVKEAKPVQAFVQEQRAEMHRAASTNPGDLRAVQDSRAVSILPVGAESFTPLKLPLPGASRQASCAAAGAESAPPSGWLLKRGYGWYKSPTVSLDGVLLTYGKWYFEVDLLQPNAAGWVRVGVVDVKFKTAGSSNARRRSRLGDNKHSWCVSAGTWDRAGLLTNAAKRVKWDDAFKKVQGGVIGCAIDVEAGTVRYVMQDKETHQVHVNVAFEGVAFEGGLIPAMQVSLV